MHLVIDGYGGNVEKMWDQQLVRDFLDQFPAKLAMTPITVPQVLKYSGDKVDDAGISGFVIIAESHISIHTFPRKDYINIDIFSCRPFDHERALDDVKELFQLTEVKTWLLDRGLEWLDERQGLAEAQQQRAALEAGGPGLNRV